MALRLPPELQAALDALESDVRLGAGAIGTGIRAQLLRLRPALVRAEQGEADVELRSLDLEREGPPDPVSLAACLAAHRAYVSGRGHPDGVSLGALALARILVWAARASLLGPAPRIAWIGPPGRRPAPDAHQVEVAATAVGAIGGVERRARAVALVEPA
jgi:hypothetical protein